MRFAYLVNPLGRAKSDDTEGHIAHSLKKLGHEVILVPEDRADEAINVKADWLLFHKGGQKIDKILPYVPYKKAFWYFDKVWRSRIDWMRAVLPHVDLACMTDETWARANPDPKIRILRQGIGDRDLRPGIVVPQYDAKVAFTGNVYDERGEWVTSLFDEFGKDFKVYDRIFNRDLFHLCASVPVFVAPPYPGDDHYWSSRIYLTLGAGGFLVHPRYAGLADEYADGVHYAAYSTHEECLEKVRYYLDHSDERERVRRAGMELTRSKFTYTERVKTLLRYVEACQ